MQTLQDMLTVEDFDVSDAFQHSRSTESIKSVASETYMSKMNVAKRRANQQETEVFYFTVSSLPRLGVCGCFQTRAHAHARTHSTHCTSIVPFLCDYKDLESYRRSA